jgi:hypothetical protein
MKLTPTQLLLRNISLMKLEFLMLDLQLVKTSLRPPLLQSVAIEVLWSERLERLAERANQRLGMQHIQIQFWSK